MQKCKKKNKENKREETSLNVNKRSSSRNRPVRTKERIEVLILYVENNARNISCRHNGFRLSRCTFNKIKKQDLKRDPHPIVTPHELRNPDYACCFTSANGF